MNYNKLEKKKLSIDEFDLDVDPKKGIITAIVDTDQVLDPGCIPESAARQWQYLEIFVDWHVKNDTLELFYGVEDEIDKYKFYPFPARKREVQMIKEVIIETIQNLYHMTFQEFYQSRLPQRGTKKRRTCDD